MAFWFAPVHVCAVSCCKRAPSRPSSPSLLSPGDGGSRAPVSDGHPDVAHTQRAASAGLLQLHVRHTPKQACVATLITPYISPPCLCLSRMFRRQDETAKGVWRSDAQHRHDHHQATVVPQLGPQDSHAVSSYVRVSDTCAGICFIQCLAPPPPCCVLTLLEATMLLETKVLLTTLRS